MAAEDSKHRHQRFLLLPAPRPSTMRSQTALAGFDAHGPDLRAQLLGLWPCGGAAEDHEGGPLGLQLTCV